MGSRRGRIHLQPLLPTRTVVIVPTLVNPASLFSFIVYMAAIAFFLTTRAALRRHRVASAVVGLVICVSIGAAAQTMLSLMPVGGTSSRAPGALEPLALIQQGLTLSALYGVFPVLAFCVGRRRRNDFAEHKDSIITGKPATHAGVTILCLVALGLEWLVSTTVMWATISVLSVTFLFTFNRPVERGWGQCSMDAVALFSPLFLWIGVYSPIFSLHGGSPSLQVNSLLRTASFESPPLLASRFVLLLSFAYASVLLAVPRSVSARLSVLLLYVGALLATGAVGWKLHLLAGTVAHGSVSIWILLAIEEISIVGLTSAHGVAATCIALAAGGLRTRESNPRVESMPT